MLKSALLTLGAVYGTLLSIGLFLSNAIMFQPGPASYADSADIIKLDSADGSIISARFLENPAADYTILFSHGNAEDLGDLLGLAEEFRQHGFSIMTYDYSGYGTSSGRPSEQVVFGNVEAAFDYLVNKKGVKPERIIAWGRSVGSGPSVHLAATRRIGGLVLESAFTSAFRVVTRVRLLPFDRFDNLRSLKMITCPVLVLHGEEDAIIPFRHGEKLYQSAAGIKANLWVERAGHNDLVQVAGARYWDSAHQFEALLKRAGVAVRR
jgi:fermentation-respiration switch protein FrsA (DUF1100 family)